LNSRNSVEVGVMIEIPSAAIMASEIAEEVDFLSIGTNDLIQYTLAVDRVNDHVSYLFTPFNPAVLRLIKGVIEMARAKGVPVSVCGEMAGQVSCVPLLVGMGVDELSMNVHAIPKVKKILNCITERESKEIVEQVLKLKTAVDVKDYVAHAIMEKWGAIIPGEFLQDMAAD
ncbi:MAG: putative PEP-binding protein, partial [Thermodesulfobacteriota bacterium]